MDSKTARKVASLARIETTDAELDVVAPALSGILKWVEQLGEVNTDKVEPLANVVDTQLFLREDKVTDGGIQGKILANAPETREGYFVVPKVVE